MLRINGLVLGLSLTLVASGMAFGQQVIQETQTTTTPVGTTEVRRVSQLIGSNVGLQGNNNFGKVEDLVFDNNGRIGYLVVSSGGRNVMMPWNAARVNYGRRFITYNVVPKAIQPFYFEQTAWPNVWAPKYITRMNQVFPPIVEERVKVKPNGNVRIKERIR